MAKIKVADIVIDYNYHHTEFFKERLKDYLYNGDEKGIEINYSLKDEIVLPPHTVTGSIQAAKLGKSENGNSIMYLATKKGRVVNYSEYNDDFSYNSSSTISIKPTERVNLTDREREYLRSGCMFNDRLIYEGGTCLHGSCISYCGKGIVFSAPCGTGKSTHTSLWKKLYGDRVKYVNDDKPAIREKNGKIYCYGTPWCGKTSLNTNISVPLAAVVFLKRAPKNRMYKISVAEAVCYLNDQTFPSVYDKRLFKNNMDIIEKIINNIPIYMLECNISDEAVILARDTIFGGEKQYEN